jgi:flagellar biosynthesis/type III secretory pathway chaperone
MEKWTDIHQQLQDLMKKEIETMRQLLANMCQEEMFILRQETSLIQQLMEERAHLIDHLSSLRQNRLTTTEHLESIVQPNPEGSSLEALLPLNNENSWNLLSLRDQMIALLDRMNLQCSRNEMLHHLATHQAILPLKAERKAKISIATLPPEGDKNKE